MDLMNFCQEVLEEEGFSVRKISERGLCVEFLPIANVVFSFEKEDPMYLFAYVTFLGEQSLYSIERLALLDIANRLSSKMRVVKAYVDAKDDLIITIQTLVSSSSLVGRRTITQLFATMLDTLSEFRSLLVSLPINKLLDCNFYSSDHIRYQNGVHVEGPHGGARRVVKIEPNINGCQGYDLQTNYGYIVTIYNSDGVHPFWKNNVQMLPKPMRIENVDGNENKIVLRGYQCRAMSPSGWINFDGQNFGLTIYFNNREVEKCILHMHDRNTDIEYLK